MSDSKFSTLMQRRWYDGVIHLAQAVYVSQNLPAPIQVLIAQALNQAIDSHRIYRRAEQYAVSVGVERIKGLYQSTYRRRWYDRNPVTRRPFNFMSTVPQAYLENWATQIVALGERLECLDNSQGYAGLLAEQVSGYQPDLLEDTWLLLRQNEDGVRLYPAKDA